MNDNVYYKLAKILDTHPSGFPATEDGLEITVLKEIFTPEQAALCCDLRLTSETVEEISTRTGRPEALLNEILPTMLERGQIGIEQTEKGLAYKMVPWAVGIFEYQLPRLYPRLAELIYAYNLVFTPQFINRKPHFLQVVPVEEEIPTAQTALPYERVSAIVENGLSFLINECVCKKTMNVMGRQCKHHLEVCLAISQEPNAFDEFPIGRKIDKAEAYDILKKAEDDALVHMVDNIESNHTYICNCCACCCGVLKSINVHGLVDAVNTHYFAKIDPEVCESCGTCASERCQVGAIIQCDDNYQVLMEKCLGCGLCVQSCQTGAIQLVRKPDQDQTVPPKDLNRWFEQRGKNRDVDFTHIK